MTMEDLLALEPTDLAIRMGALAGRFRVWFREEPHNAVFRAAIEETHAKASELLDAVVAQGLPTGDA